MRLILLVMVCCMALPAVAAPCTTLPKPAMTLDAMQIAITEDGSKIMLAWPTVDQQIVCCAQTQFDPASWRNIFRERVTAGHESTSLTSFVATITRVPGPALTVDEQARCEAMRLRILQPTQFVVRNAQRADGARPLKVLRDPTQPLSAANALINLLVSGQQAYVEAGRPCEPVPVVNSTTSGNWLYTTNVAGVRGIALCK